MTKSEPTSKRTESSRYVREVTIPRGNQLPGFMAPHGLQLSRPTKDNILLCLKDLKRANNQQKLGPGLQETVLPDSQITSSSSQTSEKKSVCTETVVPLSSAVNVKSFENSGKESSSAKAEPQQSEQQVEDEYAYLDRMKCRNCDQSWREILSLSKFLVIFKCGHVVCKCCAEMLVNSYKICNICGKKLDEEKPFRPFNLHIDLETLL